jgi:transcription elongation factor Elf1
MAVLTMPELLPAPMHCPHCAAAYKIVRVEAASDTPVDRIQCKNCGGDLESHEGAFLLKWFLTSPRKQG